ncbi:MAG: hypothetical protein A2X13_09450 [Bacteroidetes bacterium GWC2_33_15]|nr:MAG: hypothetical protein A2X10_10925 [Bacteroidetes bacterium GWA2_33_15]OFX48931.1 MAG: hypothetical protein A2X13_09450 [Bacteroidetes bacterium GWC2_33_15]OFX64805.1 MAG: hypothetical protein A2X15_05765 [Bacteroidetes bacterium GWB2_32_14]OFX68507.1 MAG: hypothetical protein A2X14_15320 [Bacteroidetes bacterium GWD2_33_33]HAN19237.1 radical SAM protein [Bacteroidales bacterium]
MLNPSYITYINWHKLVNAVKLITSYWISVVFKRVFVWGYPYAISIEPSNICNLSCSECPAGNKSLSRKSGLLDYQLFKKIIDQTRKYAIYLNLYLQGEPFLNPLLFKMIKYADENNIYTSTSTNGHFIDNESAKKIINSGLKKIIVSVDGTMQETYQIYRQRGNLNQVLSGIRLLAELKKEFKSKTPEIEIQFIVFKHNQHQVNEIQQIGKDVGANTVVLKSAQILNPNINFKLIPSIQKFARYRKKNTGYKIKSNLRNRCFRLWQTLVITLEGIVIPCCFDKNADYKSGDIKDLTLPAIWKSKNFNTFRKKVLASRKKVSICCNCTNGLHIKY